MYPDYYYWQIKLLFMRMSTIKDQTTATPARNYQSEEAFTKQNKLAVSSAEQRLPLINPEAQHSKLY